MTDNMVHPRGLATAPVGREDAPSALERRIDFRPPFDKRNPDPSKDYGIGAMLMTFYVIGEAGAVQWVISTGWYLPQLRDHLWRHAVKWESRFGRADDELFSPKPYDLGYHAKEPHYDGQTAMPCELIEGGHCFYDGSSLNAERLLTPFLVGGPEALWPLLEDYYRETFPGSAGLGSPSASRPSDPPVLNQKGASQ